MNGIACRVAERHGHAPQTLFIDQKKWMSKPHGKLTT